MKCTVCGETLDPEYPSNGRGINPDTMRWGWIHNWCLVEVIGQLTKDRKEKYDDKFQREMT